jgi:DNA polymerase III alpha subunit
MAEKGLTRSDLQEIFTGFEKRQDEKFKGLGGQIDGKLATLENRMDGKLKSLREQMDGKFETLEERVVNQFHIIAEGLNDQIKLLAEGHTGIINRLDQIEKENERGHIETRSLVKLSYAELERRLSDLESQVKEIQEWRKRVETRLQT